MSIMLTISYFLKIPEDEFFVQETGYVKEVMQEQLEKIFPKEITLTDNVVAQREHLIHYPLCENKNCLRCVSCGKWLHMPNKECLSLVSLEDCKMIKGIPLCSSCAWELEADLEDEAFVRKLKEKWFESNVNAF